MVLHFPRFWRSGKSGDLENLLLWYFLDNQAQQQRPGEAVQYKIKPVDEAYETAPKPRTI